MQVKPWARENGIPAATVFSAMQLGQIARHPDGGLDPDAATWLRFRRDRIRDEEAADASRQTARQRELDALAALAVTEITRLRRQLQELHRTTVAADVIQPAQARRQQRLQAALEAMPVLHAAEVAEAVGRSPVAVRKAMAKLGARLLRDMGCVADRKGANSPATLPQLR